MLTGKKLGTAIEAARKKKGVSKAAMAREFGVTPPSIQGWVNNGRISKDKFSKVMAFFADVVGPEHWGVTYSRAESSQSSNVSSASIQGYIPLISYVQAGEWCEAIDLYEPGYAEHILPTTAPHSLSTFALRVEGDSMTKPEGVRGPSFPDGMIIYVDPEKEAESGSFVVAKQCESNSVTFKQLTTEEGRPVLMPLNPDRTQYPVIRDEFEIIGRVIDASWGGL